jgi:hypothetical protein
MCKFFSILTSLFYTIIDIPPLHLIYGLSDDSGYNFADYITAKGTLNVFRRLKKATTIFRRQ